MHLRWFLCLYVCRFLVRRWYRIFGILAGEAAKLQFYIHCPRSGSWLGFGPLTSVSEDWADVDWSGGSALNYETESTLPSKRIVNVNQLESCMVLDPQLEFATWISSLGIGMWMHCVQQKPSICHGDHGDSERSNFRNVVPSAIWISLPYQRDSSGADVVEDEPHSCRDQSWWRCPWQNPWAVDRGELGSFFNLLS